MAGEIARHFQDSEGGVVAPVIKDGDGGFYRATHCQVSLTGDDLGPGYENLGADTCEIQICSLLAHVWNELEHDLAYKPLTGDLSEEETRALDSPGNLTRAGDNVIVGLLSATDARLAANQGEFEDQWDFVARARRTFPKARDFGTHSGQLFNELMAEGLDSPHKIEAALLQGDAVDRAYRLLEDLAEHLHGDYVVRVEPESSDPVDAVPQRYADNVLARHPGGRGQGRPPRIASAARRFRDMES